ncbi:MAG: signal peptidase I [Proteobacteria bacterium]|nr:signal peptidase I [Pseudomonadota bacterium]
MPSADKKMSSEKQDKGLQKKTVIYKGPSMNPFFQDLDFFEIIPYNRETIQAGDVVVFVSPDTGDQVAHRVISVKNGGIRTKGDNNREKDSFVLRAMDIAGKVVFRTRMNKTCQVHGGAQGIFLHTIWQTWLVLSGMGRFLFRPAWLFLVNRRPLRWLLPFMPDIRVVSFARPEGKELQAFIGKYLVARRFPSETEWRLNRFSRLMIREDHLPGRERE